MTFFGNLTEVFDYAFMRNAFLVGILISLCAGLLGVCLVLKRFSMIGDGLSHVGFGALAIGAAVGIAPLKVAIPVVIIAAIFLLRLNENSRLKGDSAIALVSTGALAVGVMAASLNGGTNIDLNNYMFGSILAMKSSYVWFCLAMTAAVMLMYFFLYNRIFAVTFDETFSKATGINTKLYTTLIAILTAITVVVGMQMMGALLMSSFIIFPALSTMRVCKSFRSTLVVSALISVIGFITGLFISFSADTPAGSTIVIVDIVIYALCSLIGRVKR